MTITTLATRNEYTSSAAQTVFTYTFKIFEDTDIKAYVTPAGSGADDLVDEVTILSVTGVGLEDGGTVTLNAVTAGYLVTLVSDIPENRTTDYQNNGDFRPDTVNDDFDRVVSIAKQAQSTANRALVFQESEQNVQQSTLPSPEGGALLRWKGDESGIENYEISTEILLSSVDSIAFLRALDITAFSNGDNVIVNGYDAKGDGGGGPIRYLDTEQAPGFYVDNGGSTIVPDGGDGSEAWLFPVYDAIDIKYFGASETRTASQNATSFQNLLGSGAKDIYIPKGSFPINEIVLQSKKIKITGSGWASILDYQGSGDCITAINDTWSGLVLRDFRIKGNATARYGISFDDGVAPGNIGNITVKNVNIADFTAVGGAGIAGHQLYRLSITKCYIENCYDGINFEFETINNTIDENFIRGFTRYGVAITALAGNSAFGNSIQNNIIDESVGGVGGAGIAVHLTYCSTSKISENHFELLDTAVHIVSGSNNKIDTNQFAVNLNQAIIIDSGAGSTLVMNNRYLSGTVTDGGARTFFFSDNPFSDVGDGGTSDSRIALGASTSSIGYVTQTAGAGIDLNARQLKGYSTIQPDSIHSIAAALAPTILTSDIIEVTAATATDLYGFTAASSTRHGRIITLFFVDGNTTLLSNQSGTLGSYLRLSGGVSFNPGAYSSIRLLNLTDGTWLEIGRTVI